jgi:CubicO group peptidase (beta-lactamase class C family)
VYQYIPEFNNNGKNKIMIQNLLLHNAGLEPDHPDPSHSTKEEIMNWTYNCKLAYEIGTRMVYSDLSFILLG